MGDDLRFGDREIIWAVRYTRGEANLNARFIDDFLLFKMKDIITYNRNLNSLLLNRNRITDQGVSVLAESVLHNPAIRTLSLAENQIDGLGLIRLFELEKSRPDLEILGVDLSEESIRYAHTHLAIETRNVAPSTACQEVSIGGRISKEHGI